MKEALKDMSKPIGLRTYRRSCRINGNGRVVAGDVLEWAETLLGLVVAVRVGEFDDFFLLLLLALLRLVLLQVPGRVGSLRREYKYLESLGNQRV